MSETDDAAETSTEPEQTDGSLPVDDAEAVEQEFNAEHGDGGPSIAQFIGSGGIKELLLQEKYKNADTGHTYSQADLVADVVNVMRMDAKQMAALNGVSVEVDKMSPERAAELLEGVAMNNGGGIIDVFMEIEDKRDPIFRKEMTEEQYEQFIDFKEGMLYSIDTEARK